MNRRLVIGSRGSKLALVQAELVKTQLAILNPATDIHIEVIKTTGDVKTEPLSVIGGKGIFTKELEDALFEGRIDLAVHSLKDLPAIIPEGLALAAICEREDPRDALVLPLNSNLSCDSLHDLPPGSIIGTSSPRRLAQLRHLRPDVAVTDLRGNVDTRLRKLDEGQYHTVILAAAGLNRLGLTKRISAYIPTDQMLPAVGQGAIGIETRGDDSGVMAVLSSINHEETRIACLAERSLLRALGGGCQLPIAAHATVSGEELRIEGLVASRDGRQIVRRQISGSTANAEQIGKELADHLLEGGARKLLD
jgi:hydroxymethylbilane synthase